MRVGSSRRRFGVLRGSVAAACTCCTPRLFSQKSEFLIRAFTQIIGQVKSLLTNKAIAFFCPKLTLKIDVDTSQGVSKNSSTWMPIV
jgi:hypothetical protein